MRQLVEQARTESTQNTVRMFRQAMSDHNSRLDESLTKNKILTDCLEKMLSEEMDWENGEIGVGNNFRLLARQTLNKIQEYPLHD
jgi:hypothetical protein